MGTGAQEVKERACCHSGTRSGASKASGEAARAREPAGVGSPSWVLLLLRGPLNPRVGGGSAPLGPETWVQARRAPRCGSTGKEASVL